MEAVEFAGHQKLDNLILIYDSNDVTLDAMAKETQSEDTAKRFKAIGWDVQTVDGHDMDAFLAAFDKAKKAAAAASRSSSSPTRSSARASPRSPGTQKAHGEGGAKFVDAARARRSACPRSISSSAPRCRRTSPSTRRSSSPRYAAWHKTFEAWQAQSPSSRELAARAPTTAAVAPRADAPPSCWRRSREFAAGREDRDAQGRAGRAPADRGEAMPLLIGGSADLYGSTLNYIGDPRPATSTHRAPRGPQHPLRHPRARHVRHLNGIASTASSARAARRSSSSPTTAARRSASRRSATCRSSTSSRTTASASARTAPPTSRSRPSAACA